VWVPWCGVPDRDRYICEGSGVLNYTDVLNYLRAVISGTQGRRLAGNLTWAGWKFFSQPTLNFSSQPTLSTTIEECEIISRADSFFSLFFYCSGQSENINLALARASTLRLYFVRKALLPGMATALERCGFGFRHFLWSSCLQYCCSCAFSYLFHNAIANRMLHAVSRHELKTKKKSSSSATPRLSRLIKPESVAEGLGLQPQLALPNYFPQLRCSTPAAERQDPDFLIGPRNKKTTKKNIAH
jgi:hypothetical protein